MEVVSRGAYLQWISCSDEWSNARYRSQRAAFTSTPLHAEREISAEPLAHNAAFLAGGGISGRPPQRERTTSSRSAAHELARHPLVRPCASQCEIGSFWLSGRGFLFATVAHVRLVAALIKSRDLCRAGDGAVQAAQVAFTKAMGEAKIQGEPAVDNGRGPDMAVLNGQW
jgi:hypothetical protein